MAKSSMSRSAGVLGERRPRASCEPSSAGGDRPAPAWIPIVREGMEVPPRRAPEDRDQRPLAEFPNLAMPAQGYSVEQIVAKLREAETLQDQGADDRSQ